MLLAARVKKRRDIGVALLLLVAAVHFGYEPLASLYPDRAAAARAIFYIARGIEGAALYLVIWAICEHSIALGVACFWGVFESSQTAVCRAVVGVDRSAPMPEAFSGLCDSLVGAPVYSVTALTVLAAAAIIQEAINANQTKR